MQGFAEEDRGEDRNRDARLAQDLAEQPEHRETRTLALDSPKGSGRGATTGRRLYLEAYPFYSPYSSHHLRVVRAHITL